MISVFVSNAKGGDCWPYGQTICQLVPKHLVIWLVTLLPSSTIATKFKEQYLVCDE